MACDANLPRGYWQTDSYSRSHVPCALSLSLSLSCTYNDRDKDNDRDDASVSVPSSILEQALNAEVNEHEVGVGDGTADSDKDDEGDNVSVSVSPSCDKYAETRFLLEGNDPKLDERYIHYEEHYPHPPRQGVTEEDWGEYRVQHASEEADVLRQRACGTKRHGSFVLWRCQELIYSNTVLLKCIYRQRTTQPLGSMFHVSYRGITFTFTYYFQYRSLVNCQA